VAKSFLFHEQFRKIYSPDFQWFAGKNRSILAIGQPAAGSSMANEDIRKIEGLFRFGRAELDTRTQELRIDGRAVPVETKVLQVLACLLDRPGETLTKDELLATAWPGRVVTEGVLAKAVMKLRAVLGDDGQRIIRTVHGFGYRLGVPVELLPSDAPALFKPSPGQGVPFRANWRLVKALDADRRGLVWQAEHVKTRDRRVFKFADDAATLAALKREITLFRLLHDALGDNAPVVRILDWNLDEPPYFIEAEWVEGGDFAAWIAGQADRSERIEAMAQVCEAVAATHALGVVHKDLKPANILLRSDGTSPPRVCLADFGIGTLSDRRVIDALGITRLGFTGTRLDNDSSSGTPLYLAPEVVAGRMPTQKSDIYALGVILFQLLVGDPRRPLAPGWRRDVDDDLLCEDIALAADLDPEQRLASAAILAQRLRTLAERRRLKDSELARLEADRQLAGRLQRARTQRLWLSALALVFLIGGGASLHLYLQAEQERSVAEAVNQFLNQDLLATANPYLAAEPEMRVRTALDRAALTVGERFADQPQAQAAVRMTLARSFAGLGDYAEAELQALQIQDLLQRSSAGGSRMQLELRELLGGLAFDLGRLDEGSRILDELVEELIRRHGSGSEPALSVIINHIGHLVRRRQDQQALDLLSVHMPQLELIGEQRPDLLITGLTLRANALRQSGQREPSRSDFERALALAVSFHGPEALPTLTVKQGMAQLARAEGRYAEAEQLQLGVVAGRQARLGRFQPETQSALNELAVILQDVGRHEEAEPLLREILEHRLAMYGDANPLTRDLLNNLGLSLSLMDRLDEAEIHYRRGLAIERELLGEDHLDVLILSHNLAGLLRRQGKFDEAITLHRQVVGRADASLGPERHEPGLFRVGLAHTLGMAGHFDDADNAYAQAHEHLREALGPEHPRVSRVAEMREEMRLRKNAGSAEAAQ